MRGGHVVAWSAALLAATAVGAGAAAQSAPAGSPNGGGLVSPAAGAVWYAGCEAIVAWGEASCAAPWAELNAQFRDAIDPRWSVLHAAKGAPDEEGKLWVEVPALATLTPGQAQLRVICGGELRSVSRPFTVTDLPPPAAPPAQFQCGEVQAGYELRCDASASCEEGDCGGSRFRWRWGADGEVEEQRRATVRHTFAKTGTYRVRLTAIDRNCAAAEVERDVEILGPNQPPVASFTIVPAEGQSPLAVQLDATSSLDPDGQIVAWRWDFGDGAAAWAAGPSSCPGPAPCPSSDPEHRPCHLYLRPGQLTVSLAVEDNRGGVVRSEQPLVIANAPPRLDLTASPPTGTGEQPSSFDASRSCDPDGELVSYRWRFDDGSPEETGPRVSHRFSGDRTSYRVELVAADDLGATSVQSLDYPVAPPRLEPDPFWLSDHPELLLGESNVAGGVQFNREPFQEEVWIGGQVPRRYDHAIAMHPGTGAGLVADADFQIPLGARYFRGFLALASESTHPNDLGDVEGRIYVDGVRVWVERVYRFDHKYFNLALPGTARIVRLEVDALGDRWADHATFVNPRLSTRSTDNY